MTMQKYAYFLMIGLGTAYASSPPNDTPLKNKVLHNLDGFFINDMAIKDIILLRQFITRMRDELPLIELQGLDTNQELKRLNEEFEAQTKQFIHIARAVKTWMTQLIDEWAQIHDRHDTLLTLWATMPNRNEHEFIKERITSIDMLRTFLNDLRSFLGDLVQSCPKGYNAFRKKYT